MEKLFAFLYVLSIMMLFAWFPLKCNCDSKESSLVEICTQVSSTEKNEKLCSRLKNVDSQLMADLRGYSFETLNLTFLERHNIQILDLGENRLIDLPEELGILQNLEYLNLMKNRISNILQDSVVNKLPSLEILVLSENPLISLKGLRVDSLVVLKADNCEIEEIDDIVLPSLPSLRTLNLTGNPLRIVEKLRSVNLTDLSLADCLLTEIPSDTFNGLPNLRNLDLQGNKLKTLPDRVFYGNKNLVLLNLRKNVLREIRKAWFERMLKLRKLDLSENEISFVNDSIFANLSKLTELHLGGNRVATLPNLETRATNVNLSKNSLGNQRLWDLTSMANVRKLDLSRNRLYGDCDQFKSTSLRILDLGYNNMTRLKRSSFSEVPNLTDLNLKGNQFSHGTDLIFEDNKILVDVELEDNPWHCNCSELHPLYSYLERGKRENTGNLLCWTPNYAKGETWWGACSDDWENPMNCEGVVDERCEASMTAISKTGLIVTSAVFGICLLIGVLIYIIYTSKKTNTALQL